MQKGFRRILEEYKSPAISLSCVTSISCFQLTKLSAVKVFIITTDILARSVVENTANDTDMDVVYGFDKGADDYITKPFSLSVLRGRVNNQLRRINARW